jgi:hypothetical protein
MAKKTFTPEQIVAKLRQIEVLVSQGKTVPLVRNDAGIVEQMSNAGGENMAACNWKDLQKENAQLRRAVAGLTVEKQVLKDIAQGHF